MTTNLPVSPPRVIKVRQTGNMQVDLAAGTPAPARHWHVRLTVSGDPVEALLVRSALHRLNDERPFLDSVRFTSTSAELEFWDEGATMLDVASLALRLWNEHRDSAGLPDWEVVGLEVMEKLARDLTGTGRPMELPNRRTQ